MDSLQDIINRRASGEPPELRALKEYIDNLYHVPAKLALSGKAIVVTVPSAALANTLRLKTADIQKQCQIEQRLIFRIG